MSQQPNESGGHPLALLCARLGARLDEIGEAPLWSAGDAEITDLVRALEVQQRRLAAWQVSVVAEATRRTTWPRRLPRRVRCRGWPRW
jgi:hypothetical protein